MPSLSDSLGMILAFGCLLLFASLTKGGPPSAMP